MISPRLLNLTKSWVRGSLWLLGGCLSHLAAAADRQWYEVTIDGHRVGYAWDEQVVQAGRESDSQFLHLEVEQLRKRLTIETRAEVVRTESGRPERTVVQSMVGSNTTGWQGSFSRDERTLKVTSAQATGVQAFNVPTDLVLSDRLLEALRPVWAEGRSSLEFEYLEPTAAKPVTLHAERFSPQPGEPGVTAILTRVAGDRLSHPERRWLDRDGRMLRGERQYLGATLVWTPCVSRCDAKVDQPYDLMSNLIVPSPYRIPDSALLGTIRYVMSRSDGTVPQIPATAEQTVVTSGASAIVTICATCGSPERLSESERQRYLRSNPWVQSDLPEVADFANRYGRGGAPNEIMTRLLEAVRDHMNGPVYYRGNASAAEALRSRSGDCTQYAVLLAALARAKNIPTRIVYGLVYADRFSGKKDVFSPHTWVQSWIGSRWRSYDAGIGQFDATHIALSIGDGDPRDTQAGFATPADLKIEKLGRVR